MASFRNGFKIFGELLLKEGLGRTRSFSEDRKPGQWLPEDQWAVRCPGSTCPPCEKSKKPVKPSKSWLSICKDPEVPLDCDVRHNNCPPPPPPKEDGPWYSFDNLIPKKKQEKPPPLCTCKEEMRRKELTGEEELQVCEKMQNKDFEVAVETETSDECLPFCQEPCPAPVVSLPAPPPKEIDLMLWCGQPSEATCRVALKCQSDRLPYQEFRPQKSWKPPPFSLPKIDSLPVQPSCYRNSYVAFSEFKYVDVPKPLYSRYKSVELNNSNTLFCMTNPKCPDNDPLPCTALTPHPNPTPLKPSESMKDENLLEQHTEKPLVESASCIPVRLKNAPKYTYRPKLTKLVERRVYKNPCAQHKKCDFSPQDASEDAGGEKNQEVQQSKQSEPPKVITGCLTDEPQTYERNYNNTPPKWMYNLTKPGTKTTPLVPLYYNLPKEPDWCSETDGLNFYDDNNGGIRPKPKPDPYQETIKAKAKPVCPPPKMSDPTEVTLEKKVTKHKNRFVLMPEKYNIKRSEERNIDYNEASFEKFIEAKTSSKKVTFKSYTPIKENILYDLQRHQPPPILPFDPSKLNASCRKPSSPPCPRPVEFYRSYSTFGFSTMKSKCSKRTHIKQLRTECGDSKEKCRVRGGLVPKARECPEKRGGSDCAEILLPCCPKANIPPTCNQKTALPVCKKKCAPKPSFSECNRDLPPCPKPTECNCWDKKPWKKD